MLSAIDRNHCPPSNGMPVRHHRNTQFVQGHETSVYLLAVPRLCSRKRKAVHDALPASLPRREANLVRLVPWETRGAGQNGVVPPSPIVNLGPSCCAI
jgi:hypothetical protein